MQPLKRPPFLDQFKLPRAVEFREANAKEMDGMLFLQFIKGKSREQVQRARVIHRFSHCLQKQKELGPEIYLLHLTPASPAEDLQLLPPLEECQLQLILDFSLKTVNLVNASADPEFIVAFDSRTAKLVQEAGIFRALTTLEQSLQKHIPVLEKKEKQPQEGEEQGQPQLQHDQQEYEWHYNEQHEQEQEQQEQIAKEQNQDAGVEEGQEQQQQRKGEGLMMEEDRPKAGMSSRLMVHSFDTGLLAFRMIRLQLQCYCKICKAMEFRLLSTHTNQFVCRCCKSTHQLFLKRPILVRTGNLLAYFAADGVFANPTRCSFDVQCSECPTVIKDDELIPEGRKKIYRCFRCFTANSLAFEGLYLAAADESKPDVTQALSFREGGPLRDNGTCVHSPHTFRLLRFSCCKGVFPCQKCHQNHSKKHDMQFAVAMICGFCSKEQRVSGSCIGAKCGREVDLGRAKSNNWEGGKGCRQKQAMSKGDKKKFRGQKKTVSRRARQRQLEQLERRVD